MDLTKDRVLVQLIATDPERAQEVVLAELECDDFDPSSLNISLVTASGY